MSKIYFQVATFCHYEARSAVVISFIINEIATSSLSFVLAMTRRVITRRNRRFRRSNLIYNNLSPDTAHVEHANSLIAPEPVAAIEVL